MSTKDIEQRSAEALVATFIQMSRSAEMARWLQQLRQRTLENRVRKTNDARELLKLQVRLDAQQSQAAVLEAATNRFRNQAPNLAQFARAGLTMEDFQRLGAHHVIDPAWLASEIEKVKQRTALRRCRNGRPQRPRPRRPRRRKPKAPAKPRRARTTTGTRTRTRRKPKPRPRRRRRSEAAAAPARPARRGAQGPAKRGHQRGTRTRNGRQGQARDAAREAGWAYWASASKCQRRKGATRTKARWRRRRAGQDGGEQARRRARAGGGSASPTT